MKLCVLASMIGKCSGWKLHSAPNVYTHTVLTRVDCYTYCTHKHTQTHTHTHTHTHRTGSPDRPLLRRGSLPRDLDLVPFLHTVLLPQPLPSRLKHERQACSRKTAASLSFCREETPRHFSQSLREPVPPHPRQRSPQPPRAAP